MTSTVAGPDTFLFLRREPVLLRGVAEHLLHQGTSAGCLMMFTPRNSRMPSFSAENGGASRATNFTPPSREKTAFHLSPLARKKCGHWSLVEERRRSQTRC